MNGSWISGDGKIAQLHALLSLSSTIREGASGGAAMVRATKMDFSADSLWVADLTPQSGAIPHDKHTFSRSKVALLKTRTQLW